MKVDFRPDYVFGDMHLYHPYVFKVVYSKDFESMDAHAEGIIERWNKKVPSDKSIVLVFGDLGRKDGIEKVLPELRGIKWLILGNHDTYAISFYEKYFEKVFFSPVFTSRRIVSSHIPIPTESGVVNLHGHTHEITLNSERHINVCPEHWDYTPILYKKLEQQALQNIEKPNHKFLQEWYKDIQYIGDRAQDDLVLKKDGTIDVEKTLPLMQIQKFRKSNPDSGLTDKQILNYFKNDGI